MFTPAAPGVYFWEASAGNAAHGAVGSANTEQRSFFVRAPGSSAADPLRGVPHPAALTSPDDQDDFLAGKPLTLAWSTTAASSLVEVKYAGHGWQEYPWQSGTTLTITPSEPGVYIWSVATADQGSRTSAVSEQRYLIVRAP